MKETLRISKLFSDLYDGSPWIGVNFMDTLSSLPAEKAYKRVMPQWNTIWEITNHIISWRLNVLRRVQGEVIKTPSHNYILPVKNPTDKEWQKTLKQLKESQDRWIAFLMDFNSKGFENVYPNNQMTYYEHMQGIIQHDAYHLGQIVIMAKVV